MLRTVFAIAALAIFPNAVSAGQSAWAKHCKPGPDAERICYVDHERFDIKTGKLLVASAIRQVDGEEHKRLVITVPRGHVQTAGLKVGIYSPKLWDQAARNEKVDESKLYIFKLAFSSCGKIRCLAQTDASDEMIETMKRAGGMMVLALEPDGKPVGYPITMAGFAQTYANPPMSHYQYEQQRAQWLSANTPIGRR